MPTGNGQDQFSLGAVEGFKNKVKETSTNSEILKCLKPTCIIHLETFQNLWLTTDSDNRAVQLF